jgi:hypothetical protein
VVVEHNRVAVVLVVRPKEDGKKNQYGIQIKEKLTKQNTAQNLNRNKTNETNLTKPNKIQQNDQHTT